MATKAKSKAWSPVSLAWRPMVAYGENTEPGMELHGKYVFLSEGVRGSLSKQVIDKFDLAQGKEPQKVWPWHERDLGD